MISIEIFKLDCDDKPISTLNAGEHIFGRGDLLECDDRRVSRNHGLITVTDDTASITSTHQNPCFYIFANSKSITILPKDSPVNISDGDKFALLADQFWFKIKVKREQLGANVGKLTEIDVEQNNNEETLKRHYEDEPNIENKKLKSNTEDCASNSNCNEVSHGCSEAKAVGPIDNCEYDESNKLVEESNEVVVESNELVEESNEVVVESEVKNETNLSPSTSTNADATAHTSTDKRPPRDYCLYGAQCYRKSAAHLAEFSHPGDSDYESDPDDSRPICSYGAACYRKNKNHRKTFKHPRSMANAKKPKGTRPKKRNTKTTYFNESSEDDYDMDDPFMADSGSEFEVEADSNESESESSDEEASEEFNRLLKEAKRFTRSRKKD